MSKKALVIVENDTVIKAIVDEMDDGVKLYKEAESFMRKQMHERWKQFVGCHWVRIKEILKERDLLPDDYKDTDFTEDNEKYDLYINDGIIYLKDKTKMDSELALHEILGHMFDNK